MILKYEVHCYIRFIISYGYFNYYLLLFKFKLNAQPLL